MSFAEALNSMRDGMKVSRNGWNGKEQFVTIGALGSATDCTGTFSLSHKDICNQVFIFHGSRGTQIWQPSQSDLLGTDWRVIE